MEIPKFLGDIYILKNLGPTGFEPAHLRSEAGCALLLRHGPLKIFAKYKFTAHTPLKAYLPST